MQDPDLPWPIPGTEPPGGDGVPGDGAYWTSEAERIARTEAQRLLDTPEIAQARAHIRDTLLRWEREVWA